MRPSVKFLILIVICAVAQLGLIGAAKRRLTSFHEVERSMGQTVKIFGLSDLCLATDARYIRNPAVTDPLAPFMDHPGSIEHFPTGSFWVPER